MAALTMTKFATRTPMYIAAAAVCVTMCSMLIVVTSGTAFGDNAGQTPAPPPTQLAPSSAAPGAPPPAAAIAPQPAPSYQPGFLHQLKVWWDDSVALFDRKERTPPSAADVANKKPTDAGPGVTEKAKEAAASAAATSQNAMKGAVEATKGAAATATDAMQGAMDATKDAASTATDAMKGAVEATKDAASAIARLPNMRMMQVNEVCQRAPNGSSDCGAAANNYCRAKGFNGGTPLDVRTSSRCDPKPPPKAGEMPAVHCAPESAITRVVCR